MNSMSSPFFPTNAPNNSKGGFFQSNQLGTTGSFFQNPTGTGANNGFFNSGASIFSNRNQSNGTGFMGVGANQAQGGMGVIGGNQGLGNRPGPGLFNLSGGGPGASGVFGFGGNNSMGNTMGAASTMGNGMGVKNSMGMGSTMDTGYLSNGSFMMKPDLCYLSNSIRGEQNHSLCHIARNNAWKNTTTIDLRIQDYKLIDSVPLRDMALRETVQNLAKNSHVNPKIFSQQTQNDLFAGIGPNNNMAMAVGQSLPFFGANNNGMNSQSSFFQNPMGNNGNGQGNSFSLAGNVGQIGGGSFFNNGTNNTNANSTVGKSFFSGLNTANSAMGLSQSSPFFQNSSTMGNNFGTFFANDNLNKGTNNFSSFFNSAGNMGGMGGAYSLGQGFGMGTNNSSIGTPKFGGSSGVSNNAGFPFMSQSSPMVQTGTLNRFNLGGGLGGMGGFGNGNQGFMGNQNFMFGGNSFMPFAANQTQLQTGNFFGQNAPFYGGVPPHPQVQILSQGQPFYPQVISSLNQSGLLSQLNLQALSEKAKNESEEGDLQNHFLERPKSIYLAYEREQSRKRPPHPSFSEPIAIPMEIPPKFSPSSSSNSRNNFFRINNRITILQEKESSRSLRSRPFSSKKSDFTPLKNIAIELAKSTYGNAFATRSFGDLKHLGRSPQTRGFCQMNNESLDKSLRVQNNSLNQPRPGTKKNKPFEGDIVTIRVTYLFNNGLDQDSVKINRQRTIGELKQHLLDRIKGTHLDPEEDMDAIERESAVLLEQTKVEESLFISHVGLGKSPSLEIALRIPFQSILFANEPILKSSSFPFPKEAEEDASFEAEMEPSFLNLNSSPFPEAVQNWANPRSSSHLISHSQRLSAHQEPNRNQSEITNERSQSFSEQPNRRPSEPTIQVPEIKSDLKVFPSIETLNSMSSEEISRVRMLVIENSFGKMEFEGPIDLRGIDFDRDVAISQFMFDVYPNEEAKPEIGFGLNRPCLLTFKEIYKTNKDISDNQFVGHLVEMAKDQGAEFISYKPESKEWTIRVSNFE